MAKSKFPKKVNAQPAVTPAEAVTTTLPAVEVRASEPKPETPITLRKPSIVRSEARANLVPINVDEEIRRLAYLLSERRGFEPGHETEDWLTAEHEDPPALSPTERLGRFKHRLAAEPRPPPGGGNVYASTIFSSLLFNFPAPLTRP